MWGVRSRVIRLPVMAAVIINFSMLLIPSWIKVSAEQISIDIINYSLILLRNPLVRDTIAKMVST